jgi:hypothetical protein
VLARDKKNLYRNQLFLENHNLPFFSSEVPQYIPPVLQLSAATKPESAEVRAMAMIDN